MKKYMYLVSVALTTACMLMITKAIRGQPEYLFDSFTVMAIVAPLFGVVVITGSVKTMYAGFRAVVFPKEEISEEQRGRAAALFRLLSKTAAIVALMDVLICLQNMLSSLDMSDTNWIHNIGGNLSYIMISLFIGLYLIVGVFEPAVHILKKRASGKG